MLWPSRKELVTYTIVVIVFVVVMVAIVAGLDVGFAKLVLRCSAELRTVRASCLTASPYDARKRDRVRLRRRATAPAEVVRAT